MRQLIVIATVLALPSFAAAQVAGALGDPSGASVPPPPTTSSASGEARTAIDPELVTLRDPTIDDAPPRNHFGHSFGAAWGGLGVGAAVGVLGGAAIGAAACESDWGCGGAAVTGSAIGAAAIAPLGAAILTWAMGDGRGGTGNFFATLGMAYLGGGFGAGLGGLLSLELGAGFGVAVGIPTGVVLAILGAALGYQITSHGPAQDDAARGPTVLPLAGATDDGQGLTLGALGAF